MRNLFCVANDAIKIAKPKYIRIVNCPITRQMAVAWKIAAKKTCVKIIDCFGKPPNVVTCAERLLLPSRYPQSKKLDPTSMTTFRLLQMTELVSNWNWAKKNVNGQIFGG